MATATQEQIVRLAPFQEQFLSDIFASAKGLTGPGSQMPFAEQQLAGLSEGQKQAITSAMQGVGSFAPFLQQGAEAVGQGIGQLGTAQQRVAAAGIDPTSYQQFMNPFMEDVIQKQYEDIAFEGAKQANQAAAKTGTTNWTVRSNSCRSWSSNCWIRTIRATNGCSRCEHIIGYR